MFKDILAHYEEKHQDEKKAFSSLLDLLGYKCGIPGVPSATIHIDKYDEFMNLAQEFCDNKNIDALLKFYYESGLNKKKEPKISVSEIKTKVHEVSDKKTILIKDFDIRCGEKMLATANSLKNKEYIYYGVSESLIEYKIALITAKLHSIPAFMICSNPTEVDAELASHHWSMANKWGKTTKKNLE